MALQEHLLYRGSRGEVSFERERAIGQFRIAFARLIAIGSESYCAE